MTREFILRESKAHNLELLPITEHEADELVEDGIILHTSRSVLDFIETTKIRIKAPNKTAKVLGRCLLGS